MKKIYIILLIIGLAITVFGISNMYDIYKKLEDFKILEQEYTNVAGDELDKIEKYESLLMEKQEGLENISNLGGILISFNALFTYLGAGCSFFSLKFLIREFV